MREGLLIARLHEFAQQVIVVAIDAWLTLDRNLSFS
jgi:hypothetical protein